MSGDPVLRKSKITTKIGNINTSFCFDEIHYEESKISLKLETRQIKPNQNEKLP